MKSRTTDRFWQEYEKLPTFVRKAAKQSYAIFQDDPYHPSLHFKRVHSTRPIFSVRITKDYRVLGIQERDEMIWFWIGSHADYERILKQTNPRPQR